jgi:hypothetical protein
MWVDNIKMDLREIGWIGVDKDKDRCRALVTNISIPFWWHPEQCSPQSSSLIGLKKTEEMLTKLWVETSHGRPI